MEERLRKTINPIIIVAVFIQIIFVIVAVLSIRQIIESNQPTLEAKVTGLTSEIQDLTEDGKHSIEYGIYQAISENSPSDNVEKGGVDIREGSLISNYYQDANVHYVSFIADIPNVNQSYRVAHIWSVDGNNKYVSPNINTAVTCLPEDQLIYGNFKCNHKRNEYGKEMLLMILRIVGGIIEDDNGDELLLNAAFGINSDDFRVRINYALCDSMCICKKASEEGKQQALNTYNDFIKGLGYEPDGFTHYFYNCENESMYLTEENNLTKTP